jgi:hypothetical protein
MASLDMRRLHIIAFAMEEIQQEGSGRKVSGEFERQVAAELLIFNLNASENDMTDQVEILANSIYSYVCVQSAAMSKILKMLLSLLL